MSRAQLVVAAIASCIGGAIVGVVGMFLLSSEILASASRTGELADATVDVSVLEKIDAGDVGGGREILKLRLTGSIAGLRADPDSLTEVQLSKFREIERRARQLAIVQ